MKFNSLFDYRYFQKGVEDTLLDGDLKNRLKSAQGYEIQDTDYFLLTDSVASYLGELKHYSKEKKFYKELQSEELTDSEMPSLFAFLTHAGIGLCDRRKVRSEVDIEPFSELRDMVEEMVSGILRDGKVKNSLRGMLK